jgi:hypothetical protein
MDHDVLSPEEAAALTEWWRQAFAELEDRNAHYE